MKARELLFNIQSEYSICVTVDGVTYVDRAPIGGGDFEDRLRGGLIFTQSIPKAFSPSVESTLGNIIAINTPSAPLTAVFSSSLKGKPYSIDICGIENKGLGNQVVTTFENRANFYSGRMNGANWSNNSMLFSFGSISAKLDAPILKNILLNGDRVSEDDISFSVTNSTLAESNGDINIDVSRASPNSTNSPLVISFNNTVTDLSLSLLKSGSKVKHTSFLFNEINSNRIDSIGSFPFKFEMQANNPNPVITITFEKPVSSMEWIFRSFNTPILNWSVTPDSIEPPIPNGGNSVVKWSNLGGITELSFQAVQIQSPQDIKSSFDENRRIWIRLGSKLWPTMIEEQDKLPVIGDFSVTPSVSPSSKDGNYVWADSSISSLNLPITFNTASSSNPVVITASGNKVTLSNGIEGLTLSAIDAYVSPSNDDSKVALSPVTYGSINNASLLRLGEREFYLPFTNFSSLRNDGIEIPWAGSLSQYNSNVNNGTLSYFTNFSEYPDHLRILISGDIGVVTSDYGFASSLISVIDFEIAPLAGIDFDDVNSDVENYEIAWHFSEQTTVREALDQILAPIDCFYEIVDSKLLIKSRKRYSKTYEKTFRDESSDSSDIYDLKVGNELNRYHSLTIGYKKNWTIQPEIDDYKNEYLTLNQYDETVKYLDFPANDIESGSKERITNTCLTTLSGAEILANTQDREKRRQLPIEFYARNEIGDIENNSIIKIESPILPDGMFIPESIMLDSDKKNRFIRGTWYGDEL